MTRSWPSGRPVPPNRPADRQRAKTVSDAAPLKQQHFLWWGGLPGALALVLTLALPAEAPYREYILIVAFAVVAFSVIVQKLTAPLALRWLELVSSKAATVGSGR